MGSIIDSLVNEDMTSVKISNSKSSRAKLFCDTVVKMRNGYLEDIFDFFGGITFSITKYTKPTFSKMSCDDSLFKPIYCKGCYIYFTTDYKSEIRVFVENPYSNEYAERQERDDNILVYDGGVGSATEEFVNNLISFVDGKCNMIDSYVNLIDKTLRDEGFTYKGTTLGYELVSATRDDDIKFGKYSTLVMCLGEDFFNAITDDVINVISDVYCEVYLESVYSKLKLPTLGCRFKIEFASKDDAKDFYKKIRGIGVEKRVCRVNIMSDTVVIECY
jgi:hypothetical protein